MAETRALQTTTRLPIVVTPESVELLGGTPTPAPAPAVEPPAKETPRAPERNAARHTLTLADAVAAAEPWWPSDDDEPLPAPSGDAPAEPR